VLRFCQFKAADFWAGEAIVKENFWGQVGTGKIA